MLKRWSKPKADVTLTAKRLVLDLLEQLLCMAQIFSCETQSCQSWCRRPGWSSEHPGCKNAERDRYPPPTNKIKVLLYMLPTCERENITSSRKWNRKYWTLIIFSLTLNFDFMKPKKKMNKTSAEMIVQESACIWNIFFS